MSDNDLPTAWVHAPIHALISQGGVFIDGDWIESKDQDPNGEVRLIQLADVGDGVFHNKSARFLTKTKATKLRCTFLKKGDLLIARMPDPLGRACVFPLEGEERFVTVVDVCIIRTSADVASPEFLKFAVNFLGTRNQIGDLQTGSTRKRISRSNLASVTIPLPPLAEQRRIVAKIDELFSELDAGEESLRKARRQLGVYRQSLLKQAFEGKLTASWRKQNPHLLESPDQLLNRIQAERQRRYLEELKLWETYGKSGRKPGKPREFEFITAEEVSQLSHLPHGWLWVRFGNVLAIRSGDGLTASQMDGGQFPVYGGNGVSGFHGSYMFEDPKLVIGRVGAKCGITHITAAKSWVTDNALICEFQVQSAELIFMKLLLNHLDLNKLSVSTAQPVVSGSKLNPLPVPLCSLPEQREIVRLLDEQFTVIEQNEREIDTALKRSAALRQSILKKAFTGQLVAQDPSDEPASALLERIREERATHTLPKKIAKKPATGRMSRKA